jgi:hypothetical protein
VAAAAAAAVAAELTLQRRPPRELVVRQSPDSSAVRSFVRLHAAFIYVHFYCLSNIIIVLKLVAFHHIY